MLLCPPHVSVPEVAEVREGRQWTLKVASITLFHFSKNEVTQATLARRLAEAEVSGLWSLIVLGVAAGTCLFCVLTAGSLCSDGARVVVSRADRHDGGSSATPLSCSE